MKLEARTIQILKNFSVLNPSLVFKEGNVIGTITPTKTVLAKALIKETIPTSFTIMELSKFLNVLSLFNNPSLVLEENFLTIKDGSQQVKYSCGTPDNVVTPGDKEIKLPDPEIKFHLTSSTLANLFKAMAVLNLPEISITGEEGILYLEAMNVKNPLADKFKVQVGSCLDTQKFKMIILADNLKILPEEYNIEVSSKGIAHFKGKDVEYWIATESSSTYTLS